MSLRTLMLFSVKIWNKDVRFVSEIDIGMCCAVESPSV